MRQKEVNSCIPNPRDVPQPLAGCFPNSPAEAVAEGIRKGAIARSAKIRIHQFRVSGRPAHDARENVTPARPSSLFALLSIVDPASREPTMYGHG
jgi:hypothetical protein